MKSSFFHPATWLLPALLTALSCRAAPPSPFFEEHARDEIHWLRWDNEAWAAAKAQNKPIYLFAGSFTNELSRAMRVQSFVNPQIVKLLNDEFICVLVDKEERPDLSPNFQNYLSANKQLNGWPANIWLTPDLKPFDGATYLPPSQEWGKEGILNVLKRVLGQWKASTNDVAQKADEALANTLASESFESGPAWNRTRTTELVNKGFASWLEHYDSTHGGFGDAPRFPETDLLRAMLQGDTASQAAALATLKAIASSPMHDVLAGGYFKRSVDAAWELPSFQKMAVDQATLALSFLDAAKVSKDVFYSDAARAALDYAQKRLTSAGLVPHAQDGTADELTIGFAWSPEEVKAVLGDRATAFGTAFGLKPEGSISADNDPSGKWKGKSLLHSETFQEFRAEREQLLAQRLKRGTLVEDSRTFVLDNALLLEAFARASAELHDPAYLKTAQTLAANLLKAWSKESQRLTRLPQTTLPAAPEDFAALASALATLDRVTGKPAHADAIAGLLNALLKNFYDEKLGRFFAAAEADPGLKLRPHALDPASGELASPEMAAILAFLSSKESSAKLPTGLLDLLVRQLDDPSGQPRGDVLLAAKAVLASPIP